MIIQTDENLALYIEESLEHLGDIENDLLAIEAGCPDIDEELVNKVFRAAHSIKGGAGFMGLFNIKELSHKMENVLGMIRSQELVPAPDIVNQLLNLFGYEVHQFSRFVTGKSCHTVTQVFHSVLDNNSGQRPDRQ